MITNYKPYCLIICHFKEARILNSLIITVYIIESIIYSFYKFPYRLFLQKCLRGTLYSQFYWSTLWNFMTFMKMFRKKLQMPKML